MECGPAGFRPAVGLRVRMNAPALAGSVVLNNRGYPRFAFLPISRIVSSKQRE